MVNANYAKLVDGDIQYLRMPIELTEPMGIHPVGAKLYTTQEDTILSFGYKPVVRAEMPTEEGYTFSSKWEETENAITQVWEGTKNPDDPYEIIDTLTGEANADQNA